MSEVTTCWTLLGCWNSAICVPGKLVLSTCRAWIVVYVIAAPVANIPLFRCERQTMASLTWLCVQSWSRGGFPKVANWSGWWRSVRARVSSPWFKKIMARGGFPGNQKTPLDTPLDLVVMVDFVSKSVIMLGNTRQTSQMLACLPVHRHTRVPRDGCIPMVAVLGWSVVVSRWHALKLDIRSCEIARVGAGMNKWLGCSLIFEPFTTRPTSPVSVFGMESSRQTGCQMNHLL